MKGLKQKICSEVFKEKIGYTEYVQLKGVLAEIDLVIKQLKEKAELVQDEEDDTVFCYILSLEEVLALLNGEKQKEKHR